MVQVLRFRGQPGDHAPGWPATHIDAAWVQAKADAEGRSVGDVLAEGLAWRATGGGPLYTETARAVREHGVIDPATMTQDDELTGETAPTKPKVPLGTRPPKGK